VFLLRRLKTRVDESIHSPGSPSVDPAEELNRLISIALPELKRRARALMRGERSGHLLQPTALVSEAFLRLFRGAPIPWEDQTALIVAASNAMGQALIDHARWNRRQKRMSHLAVPMPEEIIGEGVDALALLSVRNALRALRKQNPRRADIVQMRFFAGLEMVEIAAVLQVSERTVKREWAEAREWMRAYLTGEEQPDDDPGQ
jgi:RNA polymerase sigma factor (TIGR02999 family)